MRVDDLQQTPRSLVLTSKTSKANSRHTKHNPRHTKDNSRHKSKQPDKSNHPSDKSRHPAGKSKTPSDKCRRQNQKKLKKIQKHAFAIGIRSEIRGSGSENKLCKMTQLTFPIRPNGQRWSIPRDYVLDLYRSYKICLGSLQVSKMLV